MSNASWSLLTFLSSDHWERAGQVLFSFLHQGLEERVYFGQGMLISSVIKATTQIILG